MSRREKKLNALDIQIFLMDWAKNHPGAKMNGQRIVSGDRPEEMFIQPVHLGPIYQKVCKQDWQNLLSERSQKYREVTNCQSVLTEKNGPTGGRLKTQKEKDECSKLMPSRIDGCVSKAGHEYICLHANHARLTVECQGLLGVVNNNSNAVLNEMSDECAQDAIKLGCDKNVTIKDGTIKFEDIPQVVQCLAGKHQKSISNLCRSNISELSQVVGAENIGKANKQVSGDMK